MIPATGYTRAEISDKLWLRDVPEHLHEGLIEYIVDGRPVGGFLQAVLENDLLEAFGRADHESAAGLQNLCAFLYNDAPSACFGSPEFVRAWYEKHAEARRWREAQAARP